MSAIPWTYFHSGNTGECGFQRARRVVADSSGAVWIAATVDVPAAATADGEGPEAAAEVPIGVCRYHFRIFGSPWELFNSQSPGLPTNNVQDFSEDHAKRVWMSFADETVIGSGGAAVYDQGTWRLFKKPNDPLYSSHVLVGKAVGEAVWFGHGGATAFTIYSPNWLRFPGNTILAEPTAGHVPSPILLEATEAWVGLGNRIARRNANTWASFNLPEPAAEVKSLARGSDGRLWVGTANHGIYTFANGVFADHFTTGDGLPSNDIRAIGVDPDGRLWVATGGGLALRGNGYWLPFKAQTSKLSSDDLQALTVDGAGRLWIGSRDSGIDILAPTLNGAGAWSRQTTADGLPANNVRALATDPAGNVWAATDAGVGRWDAATGAWTAFNKAGGSLPSDDVLSIASDPIGRIWAGTASGLALREADNWQTFHVPGSTLDSDRVVAVASDGELLWASAGTVVSVRGVLTGPIGNFIPEITSFTPTKGGPFTMVTITGKYFDDRGPSYNDVRFCCFEGTSNTPAPRADVVSVTSTQLVVKVPLLASSGKITVQAHGLTSTPSAEPFQLAPVISSLGATCLPLGGVLEIHGIGFQDGSAAAYVKIGNGPERVADATDPTLIRQYIRPGDTTGPVRVRLLNGNQTTSNQSLGISQPEVVGIAIQQGIQGQPLIWGKRTLVQVQLRSIGGNCNARVDRGLMAWKRKDNVSSLPVAAYFASSNGLTVPQTPQPISLNTAVNFVSEDIFPLSLFNGARITLKNGPVVEILTFDIPASSFSFIDTQSRIRFTSMKIAPTNYSGLQHQKFWQEALVSLKDVARAYPQPDIGWCCVSKAWLFYTPIWHSWNSVDLSDESDDYEDIRDAVDDYLEPDDSAQAMALIAKELYMGGPSGKATLGHPTSVSFNFTGGMAQIFLQEGIHALDWVDEDAPNHDDGNEHHSRYDENERTDICTMSLTFRRALIDQTGAVRRVVRMRWAEAPYEFSLAGCNRANQPSSAMSYAPNQSNDSVFLEPVDYNFVLDQVLEADLRRQPVSLSNSHTLRLSGSIDRSDNVTVRLSYLEEPGKGLTPSAPDGDYHLQVRAANGALLHDLPFSLAFTSGRAQAEPLSRTRFNLRVPFPHGAMRAEIRHGNNILWSQTLSANPPNVSFTSPNGGTYQADGSVSVAWTASDPDGDPLQFGLEYSPDNGQTWTLLVPYLTGNSYDW